MIFQNSVEAERVKRWITATMTTLALITLVSA